MATLGDFIRCLLFKFPDRTCCYLAWNVVMWAIMCVFWTVFFFLQIFGVLS